MKLVQNNIEQTSCDTVNYLAICQLEQLEMFEPTQSQIDYMEEIIRISLQKASVENSIKTIEQTQLHIV